MASPGDAGNRHGDGVPSLPSPLCPLDPPSALHAKVAKRHIIVIIMLHTRELQHSRPTQVLSGFPLWALSSLTSPPRRAQVPRRSLLRIASQPQTPKRDWLTQMSGALKTDESCGTPYSDMDGEPARGEAQVTQLAKAAKEQATCQFAAAIGRRRAILTSPECAFRRQEVKAAWGFALRIASRCVSIASRLDASVMAAPGALANVSSRRAIQSVHGVDQKTKIADGTCFQLAMFSTMPPPPLPHDVRCGAWLLSPCAQPDLLASFARAASCSRSRAGLSRPEDPLGTMNSRLLTPANPS
ncbi:hypothetical protein BKA56DRAFT_609043 [Ilyonectria sp. MPI-CAGE-AT-0026]|nr:hypothetical protein BKA56DRAFT_609043 [Ilyonectria sp. MPI-CAGE-AT-0026]